MRGKLQHIVLLAMAFSILTGSVGMAATERFCAMLGMAPSAMAVEKMEKAGCCAKEEKPVCPDAPVLEKKDCCSLTTTHQKLEVESTLKLTKVEMLAIPAFISNPFPLPPVQEAVVLSTWPFYTDTSPPLAGRDLLHRLHILNI
ncbi:HYC_CC_PP family protein [Rufibacter roseus]|uniref:Uncharacterized protein n=1 Tax=Rufibacter roseus TaxID=1567108 RepID=A0ABW2DQ57_9BACT|nr:hypothetical protein [Rufibacter roseus]